VAITLDFAKNGSSEAKQKALRVLNKILGDLNATLRCALLSFASLSQL